MAYRYEAFDRQGQLVRGVVAVDSEAAAEQFLWENELTIVALKKAAKPFAWHEQFPSLFGVKDKDVISLCGQLAFLIRAGINIYTALQLIKEQTTKPALRDVLAAIIDDVSQGSTLSDACARHPSAFPVIFTRMLRVGEETGRADIALERIGAYLERRRSAMQKVKSALTYPTFVIATAGIAMYILMTIALPNMVGLFKEFKAEMPLPTRLVMSTIALSSAWGTQILVAVVAIVAGAVLYTRTPSGKRRLDRTLIGLPIFGPLTIKLNVARITDTMGSLLSSGIPMTETLQALVDTTQSTAVREPLVQIRDDVFGGSSLSQALSVHPVFPAMMVDLLRVGEEAGTLDETLATLSRLYNEEADRSITGLIGLMEPALTLGIGAVIAFISITIISTVYSILPQVK
ncbi:MAG: type II secretion system F family protein [Chloroflexi bacterium]|nr:type II secretion system F family protein [Chloroflexota bacterium]